MNLFKVLLKPDQEEHENADRNQVANAANLLQVGEFQLLQLAYRHWHGEEMPDAVVDDIFADYMLRSQVPAWARHYARRIDGLDKRGQLDDLDPAYHRYDREQYTNIPKGARSFCAVLMLTVGFMGALILLAHLTTTGSLSVLPPYFEEDDLDTGR